MSLVNVTKKPRKNWALVLYRDGSNFKTMFNVEIPPRIRPEIKVDDEREIQEFGISPPIMWDYVGNRYDEEIDHDIVDVVKIMEEPDENYEILESDILNEQLINPGKKKIIKIEGDYPNGVWSKAQYDDKGNPIYFERSDGFWSKSKYNNNGKLIDYENSEGYWFKVQYDDKGNLISKEKSNGYWFKKEYDENNNEIYYENSDGRIIDKRNQIQEQLQNVKRKNIKVIKHRDGNWSKNTYDDNNNLIRMDLSDGSFFLYDKNGREKYREDPDGFWIKQEFDDNGNLTYKEYSDGVWDRYTYNKKNQLIRYENSDGAIRNRENTNENMENKLNTGKLKLMEVLSPTDLKQIMTIASDEARKESKKVKDDLTKDVTDKLKKKEDEIKQTIDKHVQDKDHHMGKTDILKLAKDEDGKIDINKKIDDKIEKAINGKEIDKKVREMFVDAMTDYHKTLWVKRGFWSGSLNK